MIISAFASFESKNPYYKIDFNTYYALTFVIVANIALYFFISIIKPFQLLCGFFLAAFLLDELLLRSIG